MLSGRKKVADMIQVDMNLEVMEEIIVEIADDHQVDHLVETGRVGAVAVAKAVVVVLEEGAHIDEAHIVIVDLHEEVRAVVLQQMQAAVVVEVGDLVVEAVALAMVAVANVAEVNPHLQRRRGKNKIIITVVITILRRK
jgi:hypothetical protein